MLQASVLFCLDRKRSGMIKHNRWSQSSLCSKVREVFMERVLQVESIATASCPDGEDGKPCMPSEDAASLRYEPPQTQEPAQPTQVLLEFPITDTSTLLRC